jgi:hypothetical protein
LPRATACLFWRSSCTTKMYARVMFAVFFCEGPNYLGSSLALESAI